MYAQIYPSEKMMLNGQEEDTYCYFIAFGLTAGWIKTYADYYKDQVRYILNNMVTKLETFPRMRFIYAEMSFFSIWWAEINEATRSKVKQ